MRCRLNRRADGKQREQATVLTKYAGVHGRRRISPALEWTGQPVGTQQLLLVIDDVDVPLPRPLLHCMVLLEPGLYRIADGALRGCSRLGFIPTALSRAGYIEPRHTPGHGPRRYRFHTLALDRSTPATR